MSEPRGTHTKPREPRAQHQGAGHHGIRQLRVTRLRKTYILRQFYPKEGGVSTEFHDNSWSGRSGMPTTKKSFPARRPGHGEQQQQQPAATPAEPPGARSRRTEGEQPQTMQRGERCRARRRAEQWGEEVWGKSGPIGIRQKEERQAWKSTLVINVGSRHPSRNYQVSRGKGVLGGGPHPTRGCPRGSAPGL